MGLAREVRGRYWRRVVARGSAWRRVLVRQKLQPAREGACDAISSRSWLGFPWDWLFCHSMPLLWELDELTVRSESCRDCGRDRGDSFLTVITG